MLQGRADERYQDPIHLSHELLQKGVTLDGSVWLYEIANLPHVARDNPFEVPPLRQYAEPVGVYFGAAIRNMRDFLDGSAPPRSRIAGRMLDGGLVFDVAGATTTAMPIREDPALDVVVTGPLLAIRTVDAAATARWQAVTAALEHVNEPIVGPSVACRVGGYALQFVGAGLISFPPEELALRFGDFAGYSRCVNQRVGELKDQRLYDAVVESPQATAARVRSLFWP